MTAGSVIVLAFWVIFTVRKHFTPKLAAAEKANTYDLNRDNPEAKRAAQRRRGAAGGGKMGLACSGMGRKRPCGAYDRVAGVLAGCDIDRDILCFRLHHVRGCRR